MATSAKVSMRVPDGLLARGAIIAAKRGHGKLTPVMVEAICHGLGEIERQMGIAPAAASSFGGPAGERPDDRAGRGGASRRKARAA